MPHLKEHMRNYSTTQMSAIHSLSTPRHEIQYILLTTVAEKQSGHISIHELLYRQDKPEQRMGKQTPEFNFIFMSDHKPICRIRSFHPPICLLFLLFISLHPPTYQIIHNTLPKPFLAIRIYQVHFLRTYLQNQHGIGNYRTLGGYKLGLVMKTQI